MTIPFGRIFPLIFAIFILSEHSAAQVSDSLYSTVSLKKLSLEELMDIEVVSVSKRPEKLSEVSSAIQVITHADIRQAGVKTLPEALRLATNLQVAQVNASQWAISARGFNNVLANKLLVLLDGRVVYTPLYAGVFWDVQNVILDDIERIEVISGPGGTLWGSNAVNGVINIITKQSKDTKGFFAEAATGTALPALGSLRYGGSIGNKLSYRVLGTGFKMGNAVQGDGTKSNDDWHIIKGGFRADWEAANNHQLSLQANVYHGEPNPDAGDTAVIAKGDNLLFRWQHQMSERSGFHLQTYYDHTLRDFGNGFTENLKTFDIEWQHRNKIGRDHELTYGFGFRAIQHRVTNLDLFAFLPAKKTLNLINVFAQDDIQLIPERLRLTLGLKVERNSFTGIEYQPNGRLAWTPHVAQTFWAAVSRAVRTPSRIDRSFNLLIAPGLPLIAGNETFESETMLAYELGWRSQLLDNLSLALSGFYNDYDKIRTAEPGPPPLFIPITFGNGVKGHTYGLELSARARIRPWWDLRGGYTYFQKDLEVKPGSNDANNGTAESNDPAHQFLVQSSMTLAKELELGVVFRYIDDLPQPVVDDYAELDLRLGWNLNKNVEISIVAQNLLNKRHLEFVPSNPAPREIARSIYGKIICRF